MKTLKYILIILLSLGAFNSCLVDETTRYDLNDQGPNLAGFETTRTSFSFVSDGSDYGFTVKMKLIGPTSMDVTSDITVTVEADPSSTAIEGTHFSLDQPTITLKKSDNYLGLLPVTILTEGIIAPLATAPKLVLKVVSATGDPNVLNNGKKLEIVLNYGCFSNLAGTYDVSTEYTTAAGVVSMLSWTETIAQTGVGTYRTERVGHWTVAALGGTPGFTFTDVCNVLSVPEQNLVDLYSNIVAGTGPGAVTVATGDLYMEYSVCASGACRKYKSTYVKQ